MQHQSGAAAESPAFHFGNADEDETAANYLEIAGDHAQQRVAYAAAADFYSAAGARLNAAGRLAEAVPVAEKQGVALYRAGRYDAAITALEGALADYKAAGDGEGIRASDRPACPGALSRWLQPRRRLRPAGRSRPGQCEGFAGCLD